MSTKRIKVAVHQPNLCPWFPYFYKMAMADVFVLHNHVLFSKNGYQNRFQYKGKWITNPVHHGREAIQVKDYVGMETKKDSPYWVFQGGSLLRVNRLWIEAIKEILNIKTRLTDPMPALDINALPPIKEKDATAHLIDLIKQNSGNVYITNPDAKDKYLDEDKMKAAGIEIDYCRVPQYLKRSTFEILEEYGIEGARKQLPRRAHEHSCVG